MANMTYFDRMKISATKVAEKNNEKAKDTEGGVSTGNAWSRVLGGVRRADTEDAESGKLGGLLNATEIDGQLSVETAKRMLKWLAEAVGRSLELSPASDTYVLLTLNPIPSSFRRLKSTLPAAQKTSLPSSPSSSNTAAKSTLKQPSTLP